MKLGIRLQTIAEMVGQTLNIADIGSDHALLPIALLENGQIQSAVAGELGDGPYHRALAAAAHSAFADAIIVRQGDGLQILAAAEVETVVIAGMGGDLMAEILAFDEVKSRSFLRFILQPMKHEAVLRRWLMEHGFTITSERLIYENGKYYPALLVQKTNQPVNWDDLEIQLGPCLLQDLSAEVTIWLQETLKKYQATAEKINSSAKADAGLKELWQSRLKALREILDQRLTVQENL